MAMFLGHVALMFEVALFVAGIVLWHYARAGASGALRAGGLIAMVGATLSALCTGYYLVRYSVQGELDHAYPIHAGMGRYEMMGPGGMMGRGMMEGMMRGGMPEPGGAGAKPEATPTDPEHEAHHPDAMTP